MYLWLMQMISSIIHQNYWIDEIILLDIFSAGESAIKGISSSSLAKLVSEQSQNKLVKAISIDKLKQTLDLAINDGDILLMQGAGSIGKEAVKLANPAIEVC